MESITIGLQDFKSEGAGRMRSAVRNLHAGILLLFKEKLRRLSPPGSGDVLLAAKIVPRRSKSGSLTFIRSGKKTVNVQEIRERFGALDISADWDALEQLAAIRNDIEHLYETVERRVIEEAVARAFDVIDRFLRDELDADSLNLLGRDAWKVLLEGKDVFERKREECVRQIEAVNWESDLLAEAMLEARCESCGSSLVAPKGDEREAGIECRVCQAVQGFDEAAEAALKRHYSWDSYVAQDDGGDAPLADCPNCNRATYLWEEDFCVLCSESFERNCYRCGMEIPESEFTSSGLCGYCDHVLSGACQ